MLQYDSQSRRTRKTDLATGDYVESEWDHRGRLAAVAFRNPLGTLQKKITYEYDTDDRRIARHVDGDGDGDGDVDQSEHFVYAQGEVALVFDGSTPGSLTNRYLHGPDVDQVFADENAVGDVLWPLADHQHTVRDLAEYDSGTDTTTVANHRTYDSFGNVTAETNAAVDHLFAYTGREWDADAELYNYRARWYDPQAGRFVSEDPLGFDGGDVNLVRYVTNSPWNFTDPTGRISASPLVQTVAQIVAPTATSFVNTVTDWSGALRNWSGGPTDNSLGYTYDGLNHTLDLAGGNDQVSLEAGLAATRNPASDAAVMPSRVYYMLNPQQQQNYRERNAAEAGAYEVLQYYSGRTGSPIDQRPGETPLETLQRYYAEYESWQSAAPGSFMSFEEYFATGGPTPSTGARPGAASGNTNYWRDAALTTFVGEYGGAEPNAAGASASIGFGFTGLDAYKDVLDTAHSIQHWEWTWGHAGTTALNVVGLLPVVGVVKNLKHADVLVDAGKQADRSRTLRQVDELPKGGLVPSLKGNIPQADKWIKNGGRVVYHTDGGMTYIKNRISIRYSSEGYPDFSKYLYKESDGLSQVRIELTGNYRKDFVDANAAAGFKNTPKGYTWHHHEDVGLMQLVRKDVHGTFWHSGGMSLNK